MSEEAVTRRLNRAKKAAIQVLKNANYKIIPSDNSEFCIIGVRKREIRMLRIVIDEITANDIKIIKGFDPPGICTKEIWCRREGRKGFEKREIN